MMMPNIVKIKSTPLPSLLRPLSLDGVVGQDHLIGQNKPLRLMVDKCRFQSIIFWGPPGVGKTTLCQAFANDTKSIFFKLNATEATVKDIRAVAQKAKLVDDQNTIVFIDECLPYNTLICVLINETIGFLPIGYIVENNINCQVLSVNHNTNLYEWQPIISWSVIKPKPIIEIVVDNNGDEILLRCSEDHLIYTVNRGYVAAKDLVENDEPMLLDKHKTTRTSL